MLYGKASIDFKAFLCKRIPELHFKSNKVAALPLTGIRSRPLKKEGDDEMQADLLRNWYEIRSITKFTRVVSVQLEPCSGILLFLFRD